MNKIYLVLLIVFVLGCSKSKDIENDSFSNQIILWERSIQNKLDQGLSIIYGDRQLVQKISHIAHLHENELFFKLQNNMFICQILDSSEILVKKYNVSPFTGDVGKQQQKWLEAYHKKKKD